MNIRPVAFVLVTALVAAGASGEKRDASGVAPIDFMGTKQARESWKLQGQLYRPPRTAREIEQRLWKALRGADATFS